MAVLVLPGPAVAGLVGRVLSTRRSGVVPFIIGCIAGALFWFLLASVGLAAIAGRFIVFVSAIKYAGALYLLYLAYKFWTSVPKLVFSEEHNLSCGPWRSFLAGGMLNLGNPKSAVFFAALLPNIVNPALLSIGSILALGAIVVLVASMVLGAYAFLAMHTRDMFSSTRARRALNRFTACVLAGMATKILIR